MIRCDLKMSHCDSQPLEDMRLKGAFPHRPDTLQHEKAYGLVVNGQLTWEFKLQLQVWGSIATGTLCDLSGNILSFIPEGFIVKSANNLLQQGPGAGQQFRPLRPLTPGVPVYCVALNDAHEVVYENEVVMKFSPQWQSYVHVRYV